MEMFEFGLVLCAAVLVSAVIDQVVPKVSSPLIQIALGIVVALVVDEQIDIELDPELFLVLFIAPLLYDEARHINQGELWKNVKPVLSVAIGLVIAITLITGFVLHWLAPSVPLAAAFALGAALGPTDAVAVSSLPKDVNIGTRQRNILKGECLINDASGIVSFQFALAAAVTGTFSLVDASIEFIISFCGGIAVGLILGFLQRLLVRKVQSLGLENTTFRVLLDIFTPFIVYLIAEPFGASGIIAVVCAGMLISARTATTPYVSQLKIVSSSVWRVLAYALNGIVFVLLGTQLPQAMSASWEDSRIGNETLLAEVLIITAVIVLVRFLWIVAVELVHHRGEKRSGRVTHRFGRNELRSALIMTAGGAKGTITLSIMFTIPVLMSSGEAFPQRNLLIFLACGVIVCTLLISNFMVPILAPKHDLEKDKEEDRRHDVEAMIDILRKVIEDLTARQTPETRRSTQSVIHQYNNRITQIKKRNDIEDVDDAALRIRAVEREEKECLRLIEAKEVDPALGYEHLATLARTKNLLQHHGSSESIRASVLWGVMVATSALRRLFSGVPFVNEKEHTSAKRELQIKTRQVVVDELQQNIADIDAPAEDVSGLLSEYTRAIAALRASDLSITAITSAANKTADVQRIACELELEEIRQAYEDERISRATARRMRESVDLMKIDLNGGI